MGGERDRSLLGAPLIQVKGTLGKGWPESWSKSTKLEAWREHRAGVERVNPDPSAAPRLVYSVLLCVKCLR